MSAGFDISCPDLVELARQMARVDPYDIYVSAAGAVASDYEQKLTAAADAAAAPSHVVTGLSSYVDESGLVKVGPDHDVADDALTHEVGSQFAKPGGWMRSTVADHGVATRKDFGAALNAQLDASLKR
jgi:hypothetical protein